MYLQPRNAPFEFLCFDKDSLAAQTLVCLPQVRRTGPRPSLGNLPHPVVAGNLQHQRGRNAHPVYLMGSPPPPSPGHVCPPWPVVSRSLSVLFRQNAPPSRCSLSLSVISTHAPGCSPLVLAVLRAEAHSSPSSLSPTARVLTKICCYHPHCSRGQPRPGSPSECQGRHVQPDQRVGFLDKTIWLFLHCGKIYIQFTTIIILFFFF